MFVRPRPVLSGPADQRLRQVATWANRANWASGHPGDNGPSAAHTASPHLGLTFITVQVQEPAEVKEKNQNLILAVLVRSCRRIPLFAFRIALALTLLEASQILTVLGSNPPQKRRLRDGFARVDKAGYLLQRLLEEERRALVARAA